MLAARQIELGQEPKEHRPWHEPDVVESWAAMGRRTLLEFWAAMCRARLEDVAAAAAESGDGGDGGVAAVEEERHPWPEQEQMVDHVLGQMEIEPWAVDSCTGLRLSKYPGRFKSGLDFNFWFFSCVFFS